MFVCLFVLKRIWDFIFVWGSCRSLIPRRLTHHPHDVIFLSLLLPCVAAEKFVVKDFQKAFPDSIKNAAVGFMSPDPEAVENPSYRQVGKCIDIDSFRRKRLLAVYSFAWGRDLKRRKDDL